MTIDMIYKYSDYYITKRLPQIVITLNSTQKDHRAIWPAKIKLLLKYSEFCVKEKKMETIPF